MHAASPLLSLHGRGPSRTHPIRALAGTISKSEEHRTADYDQALRIRPTAAIEAEALRPFGRRHGPRRARASGRGPRQRFAPCHLDTPLLTSKGPPSDSWAMIDTALSEETADVAVAPAETDRAT